MKPSVPHIAAGLLSLAALFSYLNHKFARLPTTIGVMFLALLASLVLIILGKTAAPIREDAALVLRQINFSDLVLHGMLALLLFAGAMHCNLNDLLSQWHAISLLASIGTAVTTMLIGVVTYFAFGWLGLKLPFIGCLLFGALISPTDPIAVLGILKSARAPKSLELMVSAESLFNDGVGVVIFLAMLGFASAGANPTAGSIALLFWREVGGGLALGLVIGLMAYHMIKRIDQYQVEIPLTLAVASGGYALAEILHISAPLTVVVAGLLVGNQARSAGMSDTTGRYLDSFWEMVDEILNSVLFLLIGLQVLLTPVTKIILLAGIVAIPIALTCRFISVGAIIATLRKRRAYVKGTTRVLTWGGLRGGISVALALSLPESGYRDTIVTLTYVVVLFSILIQGLTIAKLVKYVTKPS